MKTRNFLLVFALLLSACKDGSSTVNKQKVPCGKFTLECELEKQYLLIQPLDFDATKTDLYGFSISDKNWYLINLQLFPQLLFVQNDQVPYDCNVNAGCSYRDRIADYLASNLIKCDTVLLTGQNNTLEKLQLQKNYGIRKAVIVISGARSVLPQKKDDLHFVVL